MRERWITRSQPDLSTRRRNRKQTPPPYKPMPLPRPRTTTQATGACQSAVSGELFGSAGMGLKGLLAGLAGADPVGLLDRHHEHLAVADRARAGVLEDRLHHGLDVARGHDALELDLRAQPVRELGAPVALRDALLAP